MPNTRKMLKGMVIASVGILCMIALLLSLPVPDWRTGRLPMPPLPVVDNGPDRKGVCNFT